MNKDKETSSQENKHFSWVPTIRFAGLWAILYGAGLIGATIALHPSNTDAFPFSMAAVLLIPATLFATEGIEKLAGKITRRQSVRP